MAKAFVTSTLLTIEGLEGGVDERVQPEKGGHSCQDDADET